jgi:amino acid adenylation domain-containing protein
MSIIETIREIAAQHPNARALWSARGELSYAEFMRRVEGVAGALRTRNIGPGMRVAIYIDRSAEMIIGILGILACGAAYVPLDREGPRSRLQSIIEDCCPSLLLSDCEGACLAEPFGIERLDPTAWPIEGPPGPIPHDGPAYVVYTSGSTGKPKGVVVGHASLENYLAWAIAELPFAGGGVPLFSSISFDHSATILFPPLMKGESLFLLPSIKGGRSLAQYLLTGRHYSYVKITPSHFSLLDTDERARLGRSTDLLMFGGERLPPEFIFHARRDNPDLAIMNHYGPTETTVGCCVYRVPSRFSRTTIPIGQPIPGVIASVRHSDLTFTKNGECGELLIGGKALALQYWRQHDLTKQAFVESADIDGVMRSWYRTGDLVQYLPDGNLEYLGRNDQQIKILGHRIEPGEIEQLLVSHPKVRESTVFAADSVGIPLIAAVTVSDPGITEPELRQYLCSHLPAAVVPARILILQQFPVTAHGKIDRQFLLGMAARLTPPASAQIEDLLEVKFREALGVNRVRPNDDFFELGGDSRAAVEIAMWVAQHFQIYLEAAAFFKYPSVASLAERIRSLVAEDDVQRT